MTEPVQEATTAGFVAEFTDQTDIFNPDKFTERVTVIGCGGIGGSLLPTLVTMGVREFRLYDADVVEPRNAAGGQLFRPADAHQSKILVAKRYLEAYGATDVIVHQKMFEPGDELDSVVISGVDSMSARQMIWPAVRDNGEVQLYLDGRIGGLMFNLLAVEPFDGDWYEQRSLRNDDMVAPLPCAARNVVFVSVSLGAEIGSHLARFSRGEKLPRSVTRHFGSDFYQVAN